MSYELLGITILWTFLFGYLIIASIDFGAGFFSAASMLSGKRHLIHGIIERYLSPVWEVTNVFLIFFMVGMVGFFPDTAYYFGSVLLVPGSVAIVLLAIRGSYYAFSTYVKKDSKLYVLLYGASGLLIPASLSIVLTISEGGFIERREDGVRLLFRELATSGYAWAVVLLALVSVLYISAVFLTAYASIAKDQQAYRVLRQYALMWSSPTILASLFVFFAISRHNPDHFARMLELKPLFGLSFICFVLGLFLVRSGKMLGTAFILVVLQFAFAFFGYGAAHMPYLLYPYINIYDSVTNDAMAVALIGAFIAGALVLIPSLILIARLFIFNRPYVEGKFDHE